MMFGIVYNCCFHVTTLLFFIFQAMHILSNALPKRMTAYIITIVQMPAFAVVKREDTILGKKSIKKDKNIYQLSREELELTRESASERMGCISADRIEKIESEKSLAHPDEVMVMADAYKKPNLCNYFCSHECPIGREYVPEIQPKDLSQIVLEMLASLNTIDKHRDRLIEITADGKIGKDEMTDFQKIQEQLSKISLSVESLRLWVEDTIANGKITSDKH